MSRTTRLINFIYVTCLISTSIIPMVAKAEEADSNCLGPVIPYCEMPLEERLLLPEFLLHDYPVGEFAKPQTDIFLETPIKLIDGIRNMYPHVDPKHEIAKRPLEMALSYYHELKDQLHKTNLLGIINYGEDSNSPRLYIINMVTGVVEKLIVAHGEGSDPKKTGIPTRFSNVVNSHQSSIGAMITAETYNGKNGYSLRIDGIEKSNSKIRERAIVFHGSKYVDEKFDPIGMSWGCPAMNYKVSTDIINEIKGGTLFYAWYNQ